MVIPKFTRSWTGRDWTEFFLAALIGIFTFVNAFAAVAYYCTYKESIAETSKQTDRIICAANIQADAANRMANAAKIQSDKMIDLAQQATEQATATNLLAQQTRRYADIAGQMLKTNQDTLSVSQRAYITVGRKDGIVGGFIGSKNSTQNAELVMFFQNSGHIPARLSWGTSLEFVAGNPSGIIYDHPFRPIGRTREKKAGSGISDTVESVIVPADSTFIAEIGRISQKDLEDFQSKNTYPAILGMYQYCDGLGTNTIHTFMLSYQSAPVAELSFKLNSDREFVAVKPHSDAKAEYLSPCEDLVPPKK